MPDTPIVKLMNKEEKELWQLRYGAADAIMNGLETARNAEGVGEEEVDFFAKLANFCDSLEEERSTQSSVRLDERRKAKEAAEKEEEMETNDEEEEGRSRRKLRKRDSKERRYRERRDSKDREKERRDGSDRSSGSSKR